MKPYHPPPSKIEVYPSAAPLKANEDVVSNIPTNPIKIDMALTTVTNSAMATLAILQHF